MEDMTGYLVTQEELYWHPGSLPQCCILEHFVHRLPLEHVVHISPSLLIVFQLVLSEDLPCRPIATDELS